MRHVLCRILAPSGQKWELRQARWPPDMSLRLEIQDSYPGTIWLVHVLGVTKELHVLKYLPAVHMLTFYLRNTFSFWGGYMLKPGNPGSYGQLSTNLCRLGLKARR